MIALLHGLGVGARYFGPLAAELGDVVVPEVREPMPIAAVAERFAEALEPGALVVANSMGCQAAAEIAVRRPELVGALVLVGPTIDPTIGGAFGHMARFLVDAWYEPPALTATVVRDYFAMGPLKVRRQASYALAHRLGPLLPLIEQPAIVVRGSHDPLSTAGWAREVAKLLPQGSLVTLAGAAHAAHYSHAREVADLVRRLRGTRAAAG